LAISYAFNGSSLADITKTYNLRKSGEGGIKDKSAHLFYNHSKELVACSTKENPCPRLCLPM